MDVIELAQQRQMDEVAHALVARPVPAQPGRAHCANLDCGEPIAPVRQQMGAQLCIDCQRDAERETQPCARGAA
jgi:hypothetical protein